MVGMLDGPRLPPASRGKPRCLVVLLHGYGSNGDDLIGLAPYWAPLLPEAQFIAPNAPEPVPQAPGGYQWFGLTQLDPTLMERGARAAAEPLNRFIDRELERYGLNESRLALVGFSQGTMMALHVGLRRNRAPAGILGFSGMLIAGGLKAEVKSAPPILLAHGDQDQVIPLGAMFGAADALAEAGLSAQWHISYGLPHSIGEDGLEIGGSFLAAALSGRLGAGLTR